MKHQLLKLKLKADAAYVAGTPIMSNDEYDTVFEDTPTEDLVREGIKVKFPRINIKGKNRYRSIDRFIDATKGCLYFPKFDGAAIRVGYKKVDSKVEVDYVTGNPGKNIAKTVVNKNLLSRIPLIDFEGESIEVPGEVVFYETVGVKSPDTSASGEVNAKTGKKSAKFEVVLFPYVEYEGSSSYELSEDEVREIHSKSLKSRQLYDGKYVDGVVAYNPGKNLFYALKFSPEKIKIENVGELKKLDNGQWSVSIEPVVISDKLVKNLMVTKATKELLDSISSPEYYAYLRGYTTPQLLVKEK